MHGGPVQHQDGAAEPHHQHEQKNGNIFGLLAMRKVHSDRRMRSSAIREGVGPLFFRANRKSGTCSSASAGGRVHGTSLRGQLRSK